LQIAAPHAEPRRQKAMIVFGTALPPPALAVNAITSDPRKSALSVVART
jgi:hypothetical protein